MDERKYALFSNSCSCDIFVKVDATFFGGTVNVQVTIMHVSSFAVDKTLIVLTPND